MHGQINGPILRSSTSRRAACLGSFLHRCHFGPTRRRASRPARINRKIWRVARRNDQMRRSPRVEARRGVCMYLQAASAEPRAEPSSRSPRASGGRRSGGTLHAACCVPPPVSLRPRNLDSTRKSNAARGRRAAGEAASACVVVVGGGGRNLNGSTKRIKRGGLLHQAQPRRSRFDSPPPDQPSSRCTSTQTPSSHPARLLPWADTDSNVSARDQHTCACACMREIQDCIDKPRI